MKPKNSASDSPSSKLKLVSQLPQPVQQPDEDYTPIATSTARGAAPVLRMAIVSYEADGSVRVKPLATIDSSDWVRLKPELQQLLQKYGQDTAYRSNRGGRGQAIEVVEVDATAYHAALTGRYPAGCRPPADGICRGDIFDSIQAAATALGLGPLSLAPMLHQAKVAGRNYVSCRGITLRRFKGD